MKRKLQFLVALAFLVASTIVTDPTKAGTLEEAAAAYGQGDYATALQLFRQLADQGDMRSQYLVGTLYEAGQGVLQDYAAAVIWYRRSADQGYAKAQARLGSMYFGRGGVEKDQAEAVRWFRKAAEQGDHDGQGKLGAAYAVGQGVPLDLVLAHMWLNLAAAGGHQKSAELRDAISEGMTPEQIADAQGMARNWMASHPSQ